MPRFMIVLFVAYLLFGPFLSIWALNTLFPALAIPYAFKTWLAILAFGFLIKGNSITLQYKRRT